MKLCFEELSGKAWSMRQHHIPQNIFLKALGNYNTFALLTAGFYTFDMS